MIEDYYDMVIEGDCRQLMKTLESESIDAVISDPPYGMSTQPDIQDVIQHWINDDDYEHNSVGFMSKKWDSFVPGPKVWEEAFRVVKNDSLIMSFSSTRTSYLTILSMKIAAYKYQERHGIPVYYVGNYSYIYGSGFPKSYNISNGLKQKSKKAKSEEDRKRMLEYSKLWEGYGTALKPAYEPVIIFRKGNNRKPDYPSGVEFCYSSKASSSERNKGCESLYWNKEKLITKQEYETLKRNGEKVQFGNVHMTVKPIKIMEKLIELTGLREGVILDPFAGSGTTLLAANNLGFHGIGFDSWDVAMYIANTRLAANKSGYISQ